MVSSTPMSVFKVRLFEISHTYTVLLLDIGLADAGLLGNGYREILKNKLVQGGNLVNYVGTQHSGTMEDDENEAYGGLRIEQVQAKMTPGVRKYKPNLVLILLGSNGKLLAFSVQ